MSFNSSETVSSSVAARGGLPGDFSQDSLQTYTRITIPKNSVLYDGSLVSRAAARWNCQPNCGPNPKKEGAFPETQSSSSSSADPKRLEEENARVLQMWNIRSLDDEEDFTHRCFSISNIFTSSSAASRVLASSEAGKESEFKYWGQRSRQLDQALSSSTANKEKLDLEIPAVKIEIPLEVFGKDYALANEILDQINQSGDDFSYITKDNVMLVMRIADYFLNERLLDACDEVLAGMIKKLDADAPEDAIKTFYEIIHPPHFKKSVLEKARGSLAKFFSHKLVNLANERRINGTSSCDGLNAYIKSLEERGVQILELDFSRISYLEEDHLIRILEALPGLTKLALPCFQKNGWWLKLTDRIVKSLEKLSNLNCFKYRGYAELTDELGKSLAKLSKLEVLILEDYKKLTDEFGRHLQMLSNLKELALIQNQFLKDENFTDEFVKHLRPLSNLTSLVLGGCERLTNEIGENLQELCNLQSLGLVNGPNLTDEIVESLEKLPKLKSLAFSGCTKLTDKIGKRLAVYLPNLTNLFLLSSDQFTGELIENLKLLPSLEVLDLSSCKGLKGEAVKSLAGLSHLQFLSLYGCSEELIEEMGIRLNSFPNLHLLILEMLPERLEGASSQMILSTLSPNRWGNSRLIRKFFERYKLDV